MPTETEDSLATRETLLLKLKDLGDDGSWREFFDRYWRLIYSVARKSGFNDAAARDIVQETFFTVSRHMPEFRYNPAVGSFKSWLLQITRSRIIDELRRKHMKTEDGFVRREEALETSVLESHPAETGMTLDALWEQEWREHVLEAAMQHIQRTADARQFQIFYLHVVKGVPALEVARRLGAKLPEVYFAKYKISALIKKEIKRLENKRP